MAKTMQGCDRPDGRVSRRKAPAVQGPDAVFDGNEAQLPVIGDQRANGLAGKLYRLFPH